MPIPGLSYTDAQLFPITNLSLPAWILLIVAPRWYGTGAVANFTVLVFSALYSLVIFQAWRDGHWTFEDFFSLQGIIKMFSTPALAFVGWVHYVAGDLWLGKCIAADAVARGFPHLLLAPILVMTLMLAPLGFVTYYLARVGLESVGLTGKAKIA